MEREDGAGSEADGDGSQKTSKKQLRSLSHESSKEEQSKQCGSPSDEQTPKQGPFPTKVPWIAPNEAQYAAQQLRQGDMVQEDMDAKMKAKADDASRNQAPFPTKVPYAAPLQSPEKEKDINTSKNKESPGGPSLHHEESAPADGAAGALQPSNPENSRPNVVYRQSELGAIAVRGADYVEDMDDTEDISSELSPEADALNTPDPLQRERSEHLLSAVLVEEDTELPYAEATTVPPAKQWLSHPNLSFQCSVPVSWNCCSRGFGAGHPPVKRLYTFWCCNDLAADSCTDIFTTLCHARPSCQFFYGW